jgi:acyl CoA:acetate/3-ketoacid CoA transferase beta subunit
MAVLDVTPTGLTVVDMVNGLSLAELKQCTALEASR